MSWIRGLNYLPFRGFAAVSTAVGVYVGWQSVFAANDPQKEDAARMKLKYAAVDSPRLQKLTEMDISTAISKEIAAANASVPLKVGSVAVDSPVLGKVTEETTDISTTSEETTSSDSAEALPSSTMPITSSETTDVPTISEETTSSDSAEASPSTMPITSSETTDVPATSEETTSSDSAEASPSSTMPITSSETKDSSDITENATIDDENNKPGPLGFGDCDPYEPQDYYVDPSDPDEDTEVGSSILYSTSCFVCEVYSYFFVVLIYNDSDDD